MSAKDDDFANKAASIANDFVNSHEGEDAVLMTTASMMVATFFLATWVIEHGWSEDECVDRLKLMLDAKVKLMRTLPPGRFQVTQ